MSRDTSQHAEEGALSYCGTRTTRHAGPLIEPSGDLVTFDSQLDAAIWAAELCRPPALALQSRVPLEVLQARRASLARLNEAGVTPDDGWSEPRTTGDQK